MSKKNNVIHLDRKKETIQSEIMFPDFVEKILDNDLDRQLVLVSILFKNQMRDIDNTVMVSQELIEEDKEASHAGIQKIITENKLKKGKQHGDEGIEYSLPKSWSEKKWRDVQNKWDHFEKRLEVLDGAVDWNSSAL